VVGISGQQRHWRTSTHENTAFHAAIVLNGMELTKRDIDSSLYLSLCLSYDDDDDDFRWVAQSRVLMVWSVAQTR